MQIVILVVATLVVLEFGVHVIYHAVTGKAGDMDAPFDYLVDLWRSWRS